MKVYSMYPFNLLRTGKTMKKAAEMKNSYGTFSGCTAAFSVSFRLLSNLTVSLVVPVVVLLVLVGRV